MRAAVALYLLATVDAAFCGYRAAAGRNALIDKRRYYRCAMLQGALWGQAAVALAGGALLTLVVAHADPGQAWRTLQEAAGRMLAVYLPYAAVIALAFAVRTVPSVDVRSLTSTLVFGPLTLVRPVVAVVGVAWAVAASGSAWVGVLGLGVIALMLAMEPFLSHRRRAAG